MTEQEAGELQVLRVRDVDVPEGENALETPWTLWYNKKTNEKKGSDQYVEVLKQLGTFHSVEGFYRHYTHILRPSDLPPNTNIHCFRKGFKPMWEEFPDGGCWILRINKRSSSNTVNKMWENLLIACVGEIFEMPSVVGCVLSIRRAGDVISVWNQSNQNSRLRFQIGEKLKEILELDMNTLIQYKDHMSSMKDFSTYRNAKNYMFQPSTPGTGPQDAGADGADEQEEGVLPPAAV